MEQQLQSVASKCSNVSGFFNFDKLQYKTLIFRCHKISVQHILLILFVCTKISNTEIICSSSLLISLHLSTIPFQELTFTEWVYMSFIIFFIKTVCMIFCLRIYSTQLTVMPFMFPYFHHIHFSRPLNISRPVSLLCIYFQMAISFLH